MKTTSFIQTEKFATKSERFQHVTPELIEASMLKHGFKLASLKTGRARLTERANHQTTIARYRSQTEMKIGGNYLDIVAKVPHLYGAVELFLGTYRVVCGNGLVVGTKFASFKVKHLGNPIQEIESIIPILVAQEAKMVETLQAMQSTLLSPDQILDLTDEASRIRLQGIDNVIAFQAHDLTRVQRAEDNSNDLFTVFNRIQENIVRHGLRYQIETVDVNGVQTIRNQTARRIGDSSVRSVEMNAKLWDAATSFLKAA